MKFRFGSKIEEQKKNVWKKTPAAPDGVQCIQGAQKAEVVQWTVRTKNLWICRRRPAKIFLILVSGWKYFSNFIQISFFFRRFGRSRRQCSSFSFARIRRKFICSGGLKCRCWRSGSKFAVEYWIRWPRSDVRTVDGFSIRYRSAWSNCRLFNLNFHFIFLFAQTMRSCSQCHILIICIGIF